MNWKAGLPYFSEYFDQFRYMTGLLFIVFIFCTNVLKHRNRYRLRLTVSYAAALLGALCYVPLERMLRSLPDYIPVMTAPYWLLMSLVPIGFVLFCYETNPAGALFRVLIGYATESFATILLRYLFVLCLMPELPKTHPWLYLALLFAVYLIIYGISWLMLRNRIMTDESALYQKPGRTAGVYFFVYLAYYGIISSAKSVCEYLILPIAQDADYTSIYQYLKFYLIFDMLLFSAVLGIIVVTGYDMLTLRVEKQTMEQLLRDKQTQYEFSRENIEMINRKAHDLRHQIRALEMVSDDERRQQLRETRHALDFYDAIVKTGNEALDVILTEKSVYCSNRGIRLSCTVHTRQLDRIGVVELYTLLGNAIDNAIESVEKLEAADKRVISLTIRDQKKNLFFHIENYYDGVLQIQNGLPVTTKRDAFNHGFGTKSIRDIARRYGGEAMIRTQGQVFILEIMIPVTD